MLLCSFMIFIISFSKMSKDASLLYHYSNLNKSQSKNLPWSKINQKANYLISLLKVNKIPLAHHDPNDLELPRLGILKLINTGSRRITLNKQICCLYHYSYIYIYSIKFSILRVWIVCGHFFNQREAIHIFQNIH